MHPEAIQTMINLLLQKRPLTVVQYDALSNYLEQLKAKQAKLELGDALPVTLESKENSWLFFLKINCPFLGGGTDDLLKNRIMSIMDQTLNKGSQPMFNPLPQTTIPQPAIPAAKPHMLQDPNIQQALNNLLSGGNFNFFKWMIFLLFYCDSNKLLLREYWTQSRFKLLLLT
jgi:hypothetical protein